MKRVINVSGGRSSGYMLRKMLDKGSIRKDDEVVFTNTGKEVEETYVFLREMEQRWSVPITWLQWSYKPDAEGGIKDPKVGYKVVDFQTASRKGEPFEALLRYGKYLPNIKQRICTKELKINTLMRYMLRHHGIKKTVIFVCWGCVGTRLEDG